MQYTVAESRLLYHPLPFVKGQGYQPLNPHFFFCLLYPPHSLLHPLKTTGVGNSELENQPQRTHTHISLSLERTQKRPESSEGDTITMVCYQILGGCPFTRCLFKGKNGGLAPFDSTRREQNEKKEREKASVRSASPSCHYLLL